MFGGSCGSASLSDVRWNSRIFLSFCRSPDSSSETAGPPPFWRALKALLVGANSVPEKELPRLEARPALSTSCFRSLYCSFLEIAVS